MSHCREYSDLWSFQPNSFEKLAGMWPISIGEMMAKSNYLVPYTRVPFFNFHFIREGRIRYRFDDQEVELSGGDFFCKFPGMLHTYRIVPGERPLQLVWISFDGSQSEHLMHMAGLTREKPYRQQALSCGLDSTISRIVQLCRKRSPNQMIDMYGLLYTMFSKLIAAPEQAEDNSSSPEHWISKSLDFMHERFMSNISVRDVARHINVNRSHFSETFMQQVGIPPVLYLKRLRLEKAHTLLKTTSATVTEIALQLGYTDVGSFTRAFSNYFGLPPSKVRERHTAT